MRQKSDPRIADGTLVSRVQAPGGIKQQMQTKEQRRNQKKKERKNPSGVHSWFEDAFLTGPC